MPKPALDPIIEEVSEALEKDCIAKLIFRRADLPHSFLGVKSSMPTEVIRRRAATLAAQLVSYRSVSEEEIYRLCLTDTREKKLLLEVTKYYVSDLLCSGHRVPALNRTGEAHFFGGSETVSCNRSFLRKFFDAIRRKDVEYYICLSASGAYGARLVNAFKAEVHSNRSKMPSALRAFDKKGELRSSGRISLSIGPIKARDEHAALENCMVGLRLTRLFDFSPLRRQILICLRA